MTVTVTASSATRAPLVESDPTVSDKEISSLVEPSTAAPFTDVLIKATSKVLQESLDKSETPTKPDQKGELTKAIAVENAKEEEPKAISKKRIVSDVLTSIIPIIVPPIPLMRIDRTPTTTLAIARLEKEPKPDLPKIDSVTTVAVQDSKIPPTRADIDLAEHPVSQHIEKSESELVALAASPKEVAQAVAQEVAPPHETSAVTVKPANPPVERDETKASPQLPGADRVVLPQIHPASIATTGPIVETKPTPAREPSIRVISKPNVVATEHVSSVRTISQPDVVPVWPAQTPVVASPVISTAAPSHIAQSSPHPLDVGALAGAISRPLVEAREGYTVMLAMHPVELGHLQAVVTLHGSDLHVLITPQTQVGHDALSNAVDTLKTELARGGVNVNVTLQDPGSQSRDGDRPHVAAVPREIFAHDDSLAIAPSAPVISANQINLVL